jgi:hypothetical protein
LGIGLDKAGRLMIIFSASYLACALLLIFLSVLNVLGFTTTIESKDLNNIIFLIFVVGIVSTFSMGAVFSNESGHIGAIVLAIFIAAIAFAGVSAGVILTDMSAAEKEVTEKVVIEKTKTIAERTVTVTLVEGTKTLQKEEITWLDTFIILLGASLIIVAFIACSYSLWTDP